MNLVLSRAGGESNNDVRDQAALEAFPKTDIYRVREEGSLSMRS